MSDYPDYLIACAHDGTLAVDGMCPRHEIDECLTRFEKEELSFGLMMYGAHFLSHEALGEKQVSREEWIRAERGAGFRPKSGDMEATASFGSSTGISGRHVQTWIARNSFARETDV